MCVCGGERGGGYSRASCVASGRVFGGGTVSRFGDGTVRLADSLTVAVPSSCSRRVVLLN